MRQPFERLLAGRVLAGRYELEESIGAGGMSVVFRGRDRTLGRPVAVKVISLPAESDEVRDNLRERFRREAASAARIAHHPNVVQVYDYGTDPELDLDFLVMELLRGRDLKEALAEGRPAPEEALRILRGAARGLAAGHREGIVHRDVKPANVFLTGERGGGIEYVRVLDFGIAKPTEPDGADALTTLGQIPHSPAYASPEQLDPEAPVTPASDVYQLGLIGYELLTGERAYSEQERLRIRGGEEVPLVMTPGWSAVPAPLREVIARALRRDPSERYPDASDFVEALAAADDATLLHPAGPGVDPDPTMLLPPPAPGGTRTGAAPPPIIPIPPPAPALPADAVPGAVPKRRTRIVPPIVWTVLAGVVLLALWALLRGRGGRTADAPPLPADTGALAALEEKFLRLQGQASLALEDTAAPAPDTAVVDPQPVQEAQASGGEVASEGKVIDEAIVDLHQAWSAGDLERMMSHYAGRVDYYGTEGVTRDFIRRDRARNIRQYDGRQITLDARAIEFPEPDLARALVDKTWSFTRRGERWTGAMRQELILRRRDGRWLIVSERAVDVSRNERERM